MEHCSAGRGAGRPAVARAARKAGRTVAPMEHYLDSRMVAEMEGCLAGRTSVPMAGCSAARLARFSLKGSLTAEMKAPSKSKDAWVNLKSRSAATSVSWKLTASCRAGCSAGSKSWDSSTPEMEAPSMLMAA